MTHQYDDRNHDPPAPILPVSIRRPTEDGMLVVAVALVDTGADMTCLPQELINPLGAHPVSSYSVHGVADAELGMVDSYFLRLELGEYHVSTEVLALGNQPILGRDVLNGLMLELDGPRRKVTLRASA